MRGLLFVAALALAACSCTGDKTPHKVPEHTHRRAELGMSCAETCYPGVCSSSFGIAEQAEVPCKQEAERFALCVCQAR